MEEDEEVSVYLNNHHDRGSIGAKNRERKRGKFLFQIFDCFFGILGSLANLKFEIPCFSPSKRQKTLTQHYEFGKKSM